MFEKTKDRVRRWIANKIVRNVVALLMLVGAGWATILLAVALMYDVVAAVETVTNMILGWPFWLQLVVVPMAVVGYILAPVFLGLEIGAVYQRWRKRLEAWADAEDATPIARS